MITDSQGNKLQEHSVVVDNSSNLWSVVCFDTERTCSVKCRNGYMFTYFEPKQITSIKHLTWQGA